MTSRETRRLCGSSEEVPARRRGLRSFASLLILLAIALLPAIGAGAQESSGSGGQSSPVLKASATYTDKSSTSCEETTPPITGPFAGQDPLTCHAESAPTDSNGGCTLQGMRVVAKEGNTCYYCATPTPLVDGIVIPIDDVENASQQGYLCGEDEFDQCKAVCGREGGSGGWNPPPGTVPNGSPIPPIIPGGVGIAGPGGSGPGGGPPIYGAPQPGPPPVSGAANPCQPFGPGGYDYCANPTQPPGCICKKATPLQGGVKQPASPKKPPSNPIIDTGQYLQGMMAGLGQCVQGFGALIAGVGYFAQGDFVDAAKAWGVTPGDSITLKTIYAEMTAPVIGNGSDPYTSGVTAGRRLCSYALVPGVAKAAGAGLKGVLSGPKTPVISGQALQDAINNSPKSLAGATVQLTKGTATLGDYVGDGTFAAVYKNGAGKVIKLSKNGPDTFGYGPDSIAGQQQGATILGKIKGVNTPETSGYQGAGPNSPASIVAQDVSGLKNSLTLSKAAYQKMTPALQAQAEAAVTNASNAIAKGGYVMLDANPSNFTLQAVGNTFKAIIHDPDMILTPTQIRELPVGSVQRAVLQGALDLGGASDMLSEGFTAESMMNVINTARLNLMKGITNVPSGTLPAAQ